MTSARALTLVGTLIAENRLYRDGHPYRACNTRVLASKD